MHNNKFFSKSYRVCNPIYPGPAKEYQYNPLIFKAIWLVLLLWLCIGKEVFGSDVVVNSESSSNLPNARKVNIPGPTDKKSRIIDTGGEIIIDGSVRILEGNYVKMVDLVEISTPVAPASNHARLFLTPGSGSTQQLSIIWDTGVAVRVSGN